MNIPIYVVRHGQTDLNAQRRMQGRIDVPLNDRGREQAMAAKKVLDKEGIRFVKAYASPLKRAFETGCIVSGFDEDHMIKDNRLMELDFGDNEGGSIDAVMEDENNPLFRRPHEYFPEKGESYFDLIKRLSEFIEDLKTGAIQRQDPYEGILVASHGAAVHAIELSVMGYEVKDFWKHPVNNCSVYRLTFNEGRAEYKQIFEGFPREPLQK